MCAGGAHQRRARHRLGTRDGPLLPPHRHRQQGEHIQGSESSNRCSDSFNNIHLHYQQIDPPAQSEGEWLTGVRVLQLRGEHHQVQRVAGGLERHRNCFSYFCGGRHAEPVAQGLCGRMDQRPGPALRGPATDDLLIPKSLAPKEASSDAEYMFC
jgi:hypothetical protein